MEPKADKPNLDCNKSQAIDPSDRSPSLRDLIEQIQSGFAHVSVDELRDALQSLQASVQSFACIASSSGIEPVPSPSSGLHSKPLPKHSVDPRKLAAKIKRQREELTHLENSVKRQRVLAQKYREKEQQHLELFQKTDRENQHLRSQLQRTQQLVLGLQDQLCKYSSKSR